MAGRAVQSSAPGGWFVHASEPTRGILLASGTTVPVDGSLGFAPNCIFLDSDTTGGTKLYTNVGTVASSNFDLYLGGIDLSTLAATASELNTLHNQTLAVSAAAGFTGGTGTVYKNSVQLSGSIYYTKILFDLTGLGSSTTDLDIIGQGAAAAAHIGQITLARNGTIFLTRMTCLEVPVTGVTDIDLYSATEATGKFDDVVTGLTETALITAGGAWTLNTAKYAQDLPVADQYLYVCNGTSGTVGTYTAGKFMLELFGY